MKRSNSQSQPLEVTPSTKSLHQSPQSKGSRFTPGPFFLFLYDFKPSMAPPDDGSKTKEDQGCAPRVPLWSSARETAAAARCDIWFGWGCELGIGFRLRLRRCHTESPRIFRTKRRDSLRRVPTLVARAEAY